MNNNGKATLDDFVNKIVNGSIQKNIKKIGSKIYPIRFFEFEKIEVKKVG